MNKDLNENTPRICIGSSPKPLTIGACDNEDDPVLLELSETADFRIPKKLAQAAIDGEWEKLNFTYRDGIIWSWLPRLKVIQCVGTISIILEQEKFQELAINALNK